MITAPPTPTSLLSPPTLAGATVCCTVTDADGKTLFEKNGDLRVSPASNEKLFSAAFALWELGDQFHPVTNFWKLPNTVVVESNGDPSMSYAELKNVAAQMGLDGTLPVKVEEAYAPEIPDGWEIGDLPNRYAAPVTAFCVDQSGFELWDRQGRLRLEPRSYGVKIDHTGPDAGPPRFSYDPITRQVTCSGAFPKRDERLDTLAVPSGDRAAASVLGSGFQRVDSTPSSAPTVTITGPPMIDIITHCLHVSDNIMAENLLLMAAGKEGPLPQNPYRTAIRRLKDWETRIARVPDTDVLQEDGSGLTRANLVTTRAIAALLQWADHQPTAAAWRNALASPGSGTLSRRLAGINFHGKTGSLAHVSALSGYLVNAKGETRIVSIIVNGYSCRPSEATAAMDSFVRFVSENGP